MKIGLKEGGGTRDGGRGTGDEGRGTRVEGQKLFNLEISIT